MVDKETRVKPVDFDWCAKDGVGKYPTDLNEEVKWAPEVQGSSLMRKAHDLFMLENVLRVRLAPSFLSAPILIPIHRSRSSRCSFSSRYPFIHKLVFFICTLLRLLSAILRPLQVCDRT